MDHKYRPIRITDKDLKIAFPEAKKIISVNVKILQVMIGGKEKEIQEMLTYLYSLKLNSFSKWFWEEVIEKLMFSEVKGYKRELWKLKRLQSLYEPNLKSVDNFQEKLEKAKEYPILEIASKSLELKKSGKSYVGLCPLHNERSGSFHIYPDSNQFHCYGCNEHGDSITLTMALSGISFREAVDMLSN